MRLFLPLVCLAACSVPANAQDQPVLLRTLSISSSEYPAIWIMNGKKPLKIEFSSVEPSAPVRVLRSAPFLIFQGALDGKGMPADPAPTNVNLPAASNVLLLAWRQGEKPAFMAIPDSIPAGKYDDWMVINATNKQIAVQIGHTKPTVLQHGEFKPVKIEAPAGEGAAVTMASSEGEKWKSFYSSYLPVFGDKRSLILVVQADKEILTKQIVEDLERKLPSEHAE